MKVVAYYALHYGKDWLPWSMKAIREQVDEIVVLYTPIPSYGHGTDVPCPETEGELRSIADKFGAKWSKLTGSRWEGDHRDEAEEICKDLGADIILPVDHDEIWYPEIIDAAVEIAAYHPHRNYRVNMRHFWKSVNWVCNDAATPVRVINLRGEGDSFIDLGDMPMNHFGYAQSNEIVEYKWKIHGHLGELRENWLEEKYKNWKPGIVDVHPTNEKDFWTPEPFDRQKLQFLIGNHPYFDLDIIQ